MDAKLDRYARQMLLAGVGETGQQRLLSSHALIVGCGALGTVAAESLARAGVGCLTIVDRDVVEASNLQRQTLFDDDDARAGRAKADAAASRLKRINPGVRVIPRVLDFTPTAARAILTLAPDAPPVGVVLDCTDNFEARYLVNDLSVSSRVPSVYAGAVGVEGMSRAVLPTGSRAWDERLSTPCLRCVFDQPPTPGTSPTCDSVGVLGPAAGIAALLQAGEALKILLGAFDKVRRGLVAFDLWDGPVRVLNVGDSPDPTCACCGKREFDWLSGTAPPAAARLCGRNAVQIAYLDEDDAPRPVDLDRLGRTLTAHGEVLASGSLVRCVLRNERDDEGGAVELTVFADGRSIVKGTQDTARARAIVSRLVG